MEKRRGTKGNSILSWVIAVILITAAAAAIGWFAGEGLMALMIRNDAQVNVADYSDAADDSVEPAEEEVTAETSEPQAAEPGTQAIELPTVNIKDGNDDEKRTSPFETPPWISDHLSIVPLERVPNDLADEIVISDNTAAEIEETVEEPAVTAVGKAHVAEVVPIEVQPVDAVPAPVIPNLYKVRVGPYATRQEATAAAQELAKLQLPTLIVQGYYVQIGAFGSQTNAENLKAKISGYGFPVSIF